MTGLVSRQSPSPAPVGRPCPARWRRCRLCPSCCARGPGAPSPRGAPAAGGGRRTGGQRDMGRMSGRCTGCRGEQRDLQRAVPHRRRGPLRVCVRRETQCNSETRASTPAAGMVGQRQSARLARMSRTPERASLRASKQPLTSDARKHGRITKKEQASNLSHARPTSTGASRKK